MRDTSSEYGLTVHICHDDCHIFGENAVHKNRETDLALKRRAQKVAMLRYGWTLSEWRERFYKNYLNEEDYKDVT